MSEIIVCIPAWGEQARRRAGSLVIPAVCEALKQVPHKHQFVIWTDDPNDFTMPAGTHFEKAPQQPANVHEALTEMHTRTLRAAPNNSMVCLLNADIIPSSELFRFGQFVLSGRYRVIAAFALRTLPPDLTLPPCQTAKGLLEWGWKHRHPVVSEHIWGAGKGAFPTNLFFVNGHSNAVAHCSHLHPFLIVKDNRDYQFRGTIDDGLLHLYDADEVFYPGKQEIGFVELCDGQLAPHFMQVRTETLDEDFVCEFGKNYLTSHCRNLRQPFRIIGKAPVYDAPAVRIAERIRGNL